MGSLYTSGNKLVRKPFEATLRKKNGTTCPAEIVVNVVKRAQGEILCFLALLRDMSERKELVDNLRNLEMKPLTIADFTYDCDESGRLQGFRSSNRAITRRKNHEQQDLHHALSEIKQYKKQYKIPEKRTCGHIWPEKSF